MIGGLNLAIAGGACCASLYEWDNPETACEAPSTKYCETGTESVSEGKKRDAFESNARCHIVSGFATDFLKADCDFSGTGWNRIGPTLPNGQCCFAKTFASSGGYTSQSFQIFRCKSANCP